MKNKKYEVTSLKNGAKILFILQKNSPATAVISIAKVGSKYESKDISGISHFLEHLAFKGTKKRPKAEDIAEELDALGAQYNAFTSHEFTSFYAKVGNKNAGRALDIITDLYSNPILPKKEIEKEKGVVIEELNMYEDMPAKKVQRLFLKLLYGNQPAGWDIGGRKEVIKRLTRSDLEKYRRQYYVGANTIFVVSGKTNKQIKDDIKNKLNKLPKGKRSKLPAVKERQSRAKSLIEYKKTDQTHLILGFRAFDIFDKRRFALHVLMDILGGGMSSRLFKSIRGDLGAAYYIGASADLYSNNGYVTAFSGAENGRAKEVIRATLKEFEIIKNKRVSQQELKKSKNHLIGKILLGLETSESIGYFYGSQAAMGLKLMSPGQLIKKIENVTAVEIMKVANDLFKNKKINLSLLGPFKKESFGSILKI